MDLFGKNNIYNFVFLFLVIVYGNKVDFGWLFWEEDFVYYVEDYVDEIGYWIVVELLSVGL